MAGHTPTPWFVGAQNDALYVIDRRPAVDNDYPNHDADRDVVARVYAARGATEDANAAFIVRACNAYDDLVEALKQCEPYVAHFKGGWSTHPRGDISSTELLATIQAALAKAEGR